MHEIDAQLDDGATTKAAPHATSARPPGRVAGPRVLYFQKGRGTKYAGPRIKLPHPGDPEFFPAYYAIAQGRAADGRSWFFDALIASLADKSGMARVGA